MQYVEMNTDEAIDMLKRSKGKRVLVAIQDLEKEETASFYSKAKLDCILMIKEAETIASACDDLVRQLRLFSEKQRDLLNIIPKGSQKVILLKQ